jgi:hypothetical protein
MAEVVPIKVCPVHTYDINDDVFKNCYSTLCHQCITVTHTIALSKVSLYRPTTPNAVSGVRIRRQMRVRT